MIDPLPQRFRSFGMPLFVAPLFVVPPLGGIAASAFRLKAGLRTNAKAELRTKSRYAASRDARAGSSLPRGFTLLELMIVLVVLTVFMAVAWPRITGQIQLVAPREAAIELKSDLSEAREQAVISGEPWVARIQLGQSAYEIGPVSEFTRRQRSLTTASPLTGLDAVLESSNVGVNSSQGSTASGSQFAVTTTARSRIEALELPVGMLFDDGKAHSTQNNYELRLTDPNQRTQSQTRTSASVSDTFNSNPSDIATPSVDTTATLPTAGRTDWKYVVVFQPDGRATESEIRLKDVGSEAKILLRIRGFTGGVTIDGVERRRRDSPTTDADDPLNQDLNTDQNKQGIQAGEGIDALNEPAAGVGFESELQR